MDVAVIGAGMAGLSAAIYARQSGREVDLFEQHPTPGGKMRRVTAGGYRFDIGPSILIEPWIMREPFERAGLACPLEFERSDPLFSIWYEGSDPLVVPADFEQACQLVRQYAPEDYRAFVKMNERMRRASGFVREFFFQRPIKSALDLLNPSLLRLALSLNPSQTAAGLAERSFSSPALRGILSTFPVYTEHPISRSPATALFAPFLMIQEGIFYPRGGIYAVAQAFERLALQLGVRIHYGARVERIEPAPGPAYALSVNGERPAFRQVISAADYTLTQRLLDPTCDTSGLRPAHSYFAVALGSNRSWPQLCHHTFLVPQDYRRAHEQIDRGELPDRPPTYLCAASKQDRNVAPPGKENLLAVTLVPSRVAGGWERQRDAFAGRLVDFLEEFGLPGLRASLDVVEVMSPAEIERLFGNFGGSVFGLSGEHNPLFGFRQYNADRRHPGLYYAGSTVQPGSGVPLVIRSGKFAADLAKTSSR